MDESPSRDNKQTQPDATSRFQARQNEILESARVMVAEDGFDGLTLRKLAQHLGVHLKTLQHYFATRDALIQSLLEYTNSLYDRTLETLREKSDDPQDHFERYIKFLINDEKDRHTTGFFFHMWAQATKDNQTNQVMQLIYSAHCRNIMDLLRPLNSSLDEQTLKQRAIMIIALIEGMMLFVGHGKKRPEKIGNIEKQAYLAICQLAFAPELDGSVCK